MKIYRNKNQKLYSTTLFFLASWLFLGLTAAEEFKPAASAKAPKVLGMVIEAARGQPLPSKISRPQKISGLEPSTAAISAEAFSVVDEQTKTVLLEKQPNKALPIASLTKLMTGLLAYENLQLSEKKSITSRDQSLVSPVLNLVVGDEVSYLNLLEAALVCSANDASLALADAVHDKLGLDFSSLMNQKAEVLGLTQTSFSNPLGFDSATNYSSINDLKALVFYLQNFAVFKNLGKKTRINFSSPSGTNYSCKTSNKLIGKNLEIENIKTGHTPLAKGSIIARVRRENKSLLIFVLKSENRELDFLKLTDLAFNSFAWE